MEKGRGWAGTSSRRPDEGNQATGPTADPGPAARWWPSQGPGVSPAESNCHGLGTRSGSGLPDTHLGASPQGHSEMGTSSVPDLSCPCPAAESQDESCLPDPDSLVHSTSTLHLSKLMKPKVSITCKLYTFEVAVCSVLYSQ